MDDSAISTADELRTSQRCVWLKIHQQGQTGFGTHVSTGQPMLDFWGIAPQPEGFFFDVAPRFCADFVARKRRGGLPATTRLRRVAVAVGSAGCTALLAPRHPARPQQLQLHAVAAGKPGTSWKLG